jgi:hypothetical protein
MSGALVLDAVHLVSGGRPYSPGALHGADLGFYPTVWAAFAATMAAASYFSRSRPALPGTAAFFGVLGLHLALTVIGRDLFAARAQAGVLVLWTVIFGRGLWPRLLALLLGAFYFPVEGALASTGLYASLSALDWLNPLSGPALALDLTLKEAAYQSSGLWGLGPENLSRLDFVAPNLMRHNGLSYLTALGGRGGLAIYAFLSLSVLLALGWLAVKTGPESRAASLMPSWLLITANQYLSMTLFMGWRAVGLTHPPAFVGGAGGGLEIIVLACLVIAPPGRRPLVEAS